MDFHSDETSLSGFIGGKALYNIKDKFKQIYILGVRDVEPGEPENLCTNPHVTLISDTRYISEPCHLHIDGDILDPAINSCVDHPVEYGWTLKHLEDQVFNLNIQSSSVSNLNGTLLKRVLNILDRANSLFYW